LDGHPEAMPRRHGHATQSASETGLARPARRKRMPDSGGATDPFCVDNRRATPPARVDVLTDPVGRGLIDGRLPGSRIDTPRPPCRSSGAYGCALAAHRCGCPFTRRSRRRRAPSIGPRYASVRPSSVPRTTPLYAAATGRRASPRLSSSL
jgi:hypothetical protein